MQENFEKNLLEDLEASFDAMEFQAGAVPFEEESVTMLRVGVPHLGKIGQNILFELYYTPIPEQDEADPYSVLNLRATLFTDIPAESYAELDAACAYCNPYLTLGALDARREPSMLLLQYGMLLRHAYPPQVVLHLVLDAFAAMVTSVEALVDGLAAVARGLCTAQEAVERRLL